MTEQTVADGPTCSATVRKFRSSAERDTSAQLGRVRMENFCCVEANPISYREQL
jgi:hypothetical protein